MNCLFFVFLFLVVLCAGQDYVGTLRILVADFPDHAEETAILKNGKETVLSFSLDDKRQRTIPMYLQLSIQMSRPLCLLGCGRLCISG